MENSSKLKELNRSKTTRTGCLKGLWKTALYVKIWNLKLKSFSYFRFNLVVPFFMVYIHCILTASFPSGCTTFSLLMLRHSSSSLPTFTFMPTVRRNWNPLQIFKMESRMKFPVELSPKRPSRYLVQKKQFTEIVMTSSFKYSLDVYSSYMYVFM